MKLFFLSLIFFVLHAGIAAAAVDCPAKDIACLVKQKAQAAIDTLSESPDDIVGVEVLVAARGQAIYSRWGHAALRFVKKDGFWADDMVFSFVADMPVGPESKLALVGDMAEAAVGSFSVLMEADRLGDYATTYVKEEDRGLERIILPLDHEDIVGLLEGLKKWNASSSELGDYTFLGNNCVRALYRFLSQDKNLRRDDAVFASAPGEKPAIREFKGYEEDAGPLAPNHFFDFALAEGLTPYPLIKTISPAHDLSLLATALHISIDDLQDATKWPANSASVIAAQFNQSQIRIFLWLLNLQMPSDVLMELGRKYGFQGDEEGFNQMTALSRAPEILYEQCHDLQCAREQVQTIQKLWSEADLSQLVLSWKSASENLHYGSTLKNPATKSVNDYLTLLITATRLE